MTTPRKLTGDGVEYTALDIHLPKVVCDILTTAGANDISVGFMRATANIIGTMACLAAELHKKLTPEEYAGFIAHCEVNFDMAWQVITADDPPAQLLALQEMIRAGRARAEAEAALV